MNRTADRPDRAATEEDRAANDLVPRPERRWSLHIDNDLFAFTDHDRDYTGGIAFTLTGEAAGRHRWGSTKALSWLDEKTGFASAIESDAVRTPAVQIGLLLFTPQDLSTRAPILDDRPYASLLYLSSSELDHAPSSLTAYQSTLTVGFLGLPLAADVHRGIHAVFHDVEPKGYAHQISAGGEPTLRYSLSRYRLLASGTRSGRPYSLRLKTGASIGYLTEINAGLSVRWGNRDVPWWESSTASGDYAGQPVVTGRRSPPTRTTVQLSAGIEMRARLYNAFLQGQFRHSDVAYSSSQVDHLLFEGWVGIDVRFKNNIVVSYVLRRQTQELETGRGARAFTWADLSIAQRF